MKLGINLSITGGLMARIAPKFHPLITTLVNQFGGDSAGVAIRNSTGTFKVYDSVAGSILKTAAIDEHRPEGHREVVNLLSYPEDFSNAAWAKTRGTLTTGISDPDGGNNAFTWTSSASANGDLTQSVSMTGDARVNIWLRRRTGTGDVWIFSMGTTQLVTLTSSWQRFSVLEVGTVGGATGVRVNAALDAIDIYKPMAEDVTGMGNQNPSEYVAKDTATGAELVTNGTFDADTDWAKEAGWTIASGVATSNGVVNPYLTEVGILEVGRKYIITTEIKRLASGSYRGYAGTNFAALPASLGVHAVLVTCAGTGDLRIRAITADGDIDNVSVHEATTGRQIFTTTNANTVAANVVTEATGVPLFPTKTIDTAVWNVTYPDYATATVVAAGAMMNDAGKYYSTALGGTTNGATLLTDIGVTDWVEEGIYSSGFGLLVEPAATNLMTYSEQFDNAAWTKSNVTITADDIAAPDGSTTSDKLAATTTAGNVYASNSLSAVKYSQGVFAKAGTNTTFRLDFVTSGFGEGGQVVFDLSAGTVGTITNRGGTTDTTGTIESFGNGWYRCSVSLTATAGTYFTQIFQTSIGYIHAWGAQLEAGSVPTSYIPTTTAAVTRATEAGNVNWPIANNFSNDAGVVVLDVVFSRDKYVPSVNQRLFSTDPVTTGGNGLNVHLSAPGTGNIRGYDGTTVSDNPIAYIKDRCYRIASHWNAATSKMQIGVLDLSTYGASWVWSTEVAYDGAFSTVTSILLATIFEQPLTFRNLPLIYDTDMDVATIEGKFS